MFTISERLICTTDNATPVVSSQTNNGTTAAFATYSGTVPVNSEQSSGSKLSPGALAGIIVAGVVFLAGIFAAAHE